MVETAVKNKVCPHCDAEVRPNTQFCYNCGGSLAAETENGSNDAAKVAEVIELPVSKPTTRLEPQEPANAPVPKPAIVKETKIEEEQPKLKSAATMRRKSKVVEPKRVEVIWEEHENAPNLWFILAALLLTGFAVGIFYVASYLK